MTSILPQYKMISSFANKVIQLKKKVDFFSNWNIQNFKEVKMSGE